MASYKFDLSADYFQFYLQDEQSVGDLSKSWTEKAVQNMLALAPGTIGIGTARNTAVPVELEILDSMPKDYEKFDRHNECSISIPSGKIVVAGSRDYFPEAKRIAVKPGTYRARIYYKNLDSLSEDGLDGDDSYKIAFWLSDDTSVRVLGRIVKK